MDNRTLALNALQVMLTKPEFDQAEIAQYFAPSYQQTVNGLELDYVEFVAHVAKLKKDTKNRRITILACAAEGEHVFTHHQVSAEKANGESVMFEVIANFTLTEGKIVRCQELTRMIQGQAHDEDLGSRH
ncbi:nuclear transport factor 2 family protein [Vibrio pectenicida]|uniref:Nuclear transport factor 2 family protein n=1 Tax=Vibrio pectenicida TaxID=62763 RepID=A0A7Y4ECT3_9VIBR|nr:nuclear transport factor 2 family protein [Vibrio pectenicida]NOH69949.1 nuclear transport factor 2 family protein [Vibrio pectenicida]